MTAAVLAAGVVLPPDDGAADWFDVGARLGKRGYKYLPRACQYVLAAAREAVGGAALDGVPADDRAVAIGTNNAGAPLLDAIDRKVLAGRAAELSPATAPFFAVNVLGSRISVEHGFKGFNLTLTSPAIAGVEALEVGVRALAAGRARVLLAGAMDDRDPGGGATREGAVVLMLGAPSSANGKGYVRAKTAFVPPSSLSSCVGRDRAIETVEELVASVADGAAPPVHAVLDGSPVGEVVRSALVSAGGGRYPLASTRPVDSGCLGPLVLLGNLLDDGADGLVVTATASGNVAAVGFRMATGKGGQ